MECRFCRRSFSKGEHLRRHERSHTGSRPFVCKDCDRAFSRQDSLARHERLHARKESSRHTSPRPRSTYNPITPESFKEFDVNTCPSAYSDNLHGDLSSLQGHSLTEADLPQIPPSAEIDFELIWPDSEDLYQSIVSFDASSQWQMPLGALPFISEPLIPSNVSLGSPSSFDDRASSIGVIPSGANHKAVHDVSKMVAFSSSSVTAAVESTSITSVFLDECLHMFFVRFIPTFPVLHRPTFIFRDCTHPLLLNAIAIGSLYLGPKDAVAKGEVLWRLAHTALATSWQSLITHRGPYDSCPGVQLLVTALLGQIYGALSKNRAVRTTSQAFHALGFFWARHCGMFDCEPWPISKLPALGASPAEKDHHWKRWVAREIQQRALLAHYMLDGLIAQMTGEPTAERHAANKLTLPNSEALFDAGSADEWLSQMCSLNIDQASCRTLLPLLFSPAQDMRTHCFNNSAFSLRVILESLQSLLSDLHGDQEPVLGTPTVREVRKALARIYEIIMQAANLSQEERLETLLRWHTICLDSVMNSTTVGKSLCSRYKIEQYIWPGTSPAKPLADLDKISTTVAGRKALVHAIAIQDIVEQLPRGRAHVTYMPSSLFAATTVYSVFSSAGQISVRLPTSVDWKEVLSDLGDPYLDPTNAGSPSDTTRYLSGEQLPNNYISSTTRNLLYEFNSMQKLFRCLYTQWGVAFDMEKIVDQWISQCH